MFARSQKNIQAIRPSTLRRGQTEIMSPQGTHILHKSLSELRGEEVVKQVPEAPCLDGKVPTCYLRKSAGTLEDYVLTDASEKSDHFIICTCSFELFKYVCTLR